MNRNELLRLARSGAQARLQELRAEISAILRQFPGLGSRADQDPGGGKGSGTRRRRPRLSAAARKRISDAQKKRWADLRKKQGKAAA